ncbi:unnamed protein product [Trifolium pratense]|uniref:Uncharacterized protein n=1 Tax=Trifolium pratense TaxID=57577 RepID=A0ACB0LAX0_TRIPR|nr:unnamed protein product [Trifolium pratense]
MTKILKFVYTITFFVSLFLVVVNVGGGKCISDVHCMYLSCRSRQIKHCLQSECYCINRVDEKVVFYYA